MADVETSTADILDEIDLHPREQFEVQNSTHSSFVGFMIAVMMIGIFVILVSTHFNPIALAALVILAVALVVNMLWRSVTRRRRSGPANLLLTARIKADLLTDLNAGNVRVDNSRGIVTLHGTVPYANFREEAARLARRAGALQVINELTVAQDTAKPADDYLKGFVGVTTPEGAPEVTPTVTLEETVLEALEADPRVNARLIDVQVELGIAYLTGRQPTVEASQSATAVTAHVPGILGVSNAIEILPGL
jgi:osmotically-inducible protein OsmY